MSEQENNERQHWERDVLANLAHAALDEQRKSRRWGIFFKILAFIYLTLFLLLLVSGGESLEAAKSREHTAVVDIDGVIAASSQSDADNVIGAVRAAFKAEKSKGIILRINSPGGSPVQAGYIYDEIRRLRKEYPDKPVYAVVTDMCASGGYYIAAAADKIYANRASVVGSIGVLMNGFGFTQTMDKVGVQRRLYTAGAHKGFLDPFSPINKDDVAHLQGMLDDIHKQFIAAVKAGRGARLKDDPNLFSGLVWTGEQAVSLGLVDALASPRYVAREVIGAKEMVNYTRKPDLFERFASRIGVSFAGAVHEMLTGLSIR